MALESLEDRRLLATVTGQKFHDIDADGQKDSGEPGLNGWTIELLDTGGSLVGTRTTADRDLDANGQIDPATESGLYEFTGLAAGTYVVREVLQPGWVQTTSNTTTDLASQLDQQYGFFIDLDVYLNWQGANEKWVRAANQNDDWFYILPNGNLFDWDDMSGLRFGQTPINGTLIAELGPEYYVFPGLLASAPPAGSSVVTPGSGTARADFGNFPPNSLHGRKWHDLDADGTRDAGEPFLNGWTIELLDAAGTVARTTTTMDMDVDGSGAIDPETETGLYWFDGLIAGSYTVREVRPAGWVQSAPLGDVELTFALGEGQENPPTGSQATGSCTSVLSADQSSFQVDCTHDVVETTAAHIHRAPVGTNGPVIIGFASGASPLSLTWDASSTPPLSAQEVADLLAGNMYVNVHSPTFPGGEIRGQIPAATQQAGNHEVSVAGGQRVEGLDFGNYQPASVHGRKWHDLDGDGQPDADEPFLNGWTIELVDETGSVVASTLTMDMDVDGSGGIDPTTESGLYWFDDLKPGSYTVREVLPDGWVQTGPLSDVELTFALSEAQENPPTGSPATGACTAVLSADGSSIQVDCTHDVAETTAAHIHHAPVGTNGPVIIGFASGASPLSLTWDANSTPPLSAHDVEDFLAGNLYVNVHSPTFPGGEIRGQIPAASLVVDHYEVALDSGERAEGLDFGNLQLGSVHGRKWNDLNGNGARDPDEPHLNGWTIELVQGDVVIATVTTADMDLNGDGQIDPETESGWYWFDDLIPGAYTVREVQQDGFVQSSPTPPLHHEVIVVGGLALDHINFGNTELTVEIVAVTPNPRAGRVDSITIVFSHPVNGFDVGDLRLVLVNDATVDISLASATLTTADNITWTLGNLGGSTGTAGIYALGLNSASAGIVDVIYANALLADDMTLWINGPGDADLNGQFDQLDIVRVLQIAKFLSGPPANWGEGDWNGSDQFDETDLDTAKEPGHYLQGPFDTPGFGPGSPEAIDAVFEAVAFLGDPTPGADTFLSYFFPEGLNNSGEVAFAADVSPCEGFDTCEATFRGTAGNLSQVLRTGQPAPGGGTLLFTLNARQAINERGDIVENWFPDPFSGPGNNIGVYLYSAGTGTISPVVIPEVTPAPAGGVFHAAAIPVINNPGEIVFVANITTDNGIHLPDEPYTGTGFGVFKLSTDGQITSVASPGDPAAGGGILDFVRTAATNDQGDVVFFGHLAGEPCGAWFPQSEQDSCLYLNMYIHRAATGQTELVVRTGDASVGGGNSVDDAVMNNQGQVAFEVGDVQPPPVFVDNLGMYLFDGSTILPVALPGDSMPGGGHIVNVGGFIGDHDLNNLGTVAFAATLDTDENADGSPDTGVYLWSQGSTQLVARTGTIIPGVGTVATIGPSVFEAMWVRTNDLGQVFFSATLTDGRGVLLLATPRQ